MHSSQTLSPQGKIPEMRHVDILLQGAFNQPFAEGQQFLCEPGLSAQLSICTVSSFLQQVLFKNPQASAKVQNILKDLIKLRSFGEGTSPSQSRQLLPILQSRWQDKGQKGKMLEFVPSYGLLAAPADCHADCSPFYKDFHRQHLLKKSEHSFAEEPFVPIGMIVLG